MTKPLTPSDLLHALTMALGTGPETVGSAPLVTRHSLREARDRLHILLAEDDVINQRLAMHLLKRRGHTVVIADNGKEVLARLAQERFDLVLMDVQMPEMGGLEATAVIRERERATDEHIPIIALTAHAMQSDRERCLQAGMDGYLSKPIQRQELFTAVEELVLPVAV